MPTTRTKRDAEEPLLSLSLVKRRKIVRNVRNTEKIGAIQKAYEEATSRSPVNFVENFLENHICSPRCTGPNSNCPMPQSDDEEEEEDNVLNTSDNNQNISAEIESIDGDSELQFEELEAEADNNLQEKSSRKKRGQNVGFVLIEEFENKSELDQYIFDNGCLKSMNKKVMCPMGAFKC